MILSVFAIGVLQAAALVRGDPFVVRMKPGEDLVGTAGVREQLAEGGDDTGPIYLVDCPVGGCDWFDVVESAEVDAEVSLEKTDESASWATNSWGLDRVDGVKDGDYARGAGTGSGSTVFVMDTGVFAGHSDFLGYKSSKTRVARGFDAVSDSGGPANTDCHGHGTHVASIAAGRVWGVAKDADIVPVRVMGCTGRGTTSGIIRGIEWVRKYKAARKVVNMSFGGTKSTSMGAALDRLRKGGAIPVVAAGNGDSSACGRSPSGDAAAVTVASTDETDSRSGFSNFGKCVDIFAPGSGITAADTKSKKGSTVKSGTSMASPFVAGVMATAWAAFPGSISEEVVALVTDTWAERGVITDVRAGSPNRMLVNTGGASSRAPTPSPVLVREDCLAIKGKHVCNAAWNCRHYPRGVGCHTKGYCGFRRRSQCGNWKYCRWRNGFGCQHKKWCGATTEAGCVDVGCVWVETQCRDPEFV